MMWTALMTIMLSAPTSTNVAVVDMERIAREYNDLKSARFELDRLLRDWQRVRDSLQQELEKLRTRYRQERPAMSETQRLRTERELEEKEQHLKSYVQRIWGKGGELERKTRELVQPFLDRVYETIQKYAAEGGYELVLDKKEAGVVYATRAVDLTDEVLQELNRTAVALPGAGIRPRLLVGLIREADVQVRQQGWGRKVQEYLRSGLAGTDRFDVLGLGETNRAFQQLNLLPENVRNEDVRRVAQQLNAAYYIYGEISMRGDKLSYVFRLVETQSGNEIASVTGQASTSSQLTVQNEIQNAANHLSSQYAEKVLGEGG